MTTTHELTDVLTRVMGDDKLCKRFLQDPQLIVKQYPDLDIEQRDLLVRFFATTAACLQEELRGSRFAQERLEQIFLSSRKAFNDIRVMNWIAFGIGIVLIALSVRLGATGQREVYVALFGTMGVVTLVAYLLVRPMHGVRNALSDFLQAHIIFDTANQQIGVWHHFEPGCEEEVEKASRALQGIRETTVRLLEDVLEGKKGRLSGKEAVP